MGNRHHDKKLRAAVRARMARTGESYQQALASLRSESRIMVPSARVDLVPMSWYGGGAALAVIEHLGVTSVMVVSAPHRRLPFAVPMSARHPANGDLRDDGYTIVRGLLGSVERRALRVACDASLDRVRASSHETGHSTPRITLDVPSAWELFGERRIVSRLPADVDRLRTVHYYHEQTKRDWVGLWHRDPNEVHARVALSEDHCLEIVPGSHRRAGDATSDARRIVLAAGDLCIFDASTLHRAVYRRHPPRRTIDAVFTLRSDRREW